MNNRRTPEYIPGKIPDSEKAELKEDIQLAQNPDGTLRVIKSKKQFKEAAEEHREGMKDLQ